MAVIRSPRVDHHSFEFVLEVILLVSAVFQLVLQLFRFQMRILVPGGDSFLGKGFQVNCLPEFEFRVDFLVLIDVEVENNPLEVDDQHIGQLRQTHLLHNIVLLVALLAGVIRNYLALNQLT